MKKPEPTKPRKKAPKKTVQVDENEIDSFEQHEPMGFCVGIGASAGGLEALEQFFKNMPYDSGLSFVVVQHLSPDYKSLMVELLSKHTRMKVYRAEDGMTILPNCIYLIPPKKNMTVFHGKLFLTEQDHHHVINLPIDIFLRSLAEDFTDKSIGIILSGTGSDGTLGIRAIKGIGGMVMAQDDSSAKFDGMPKSAIATGLVDYILPADKMPEELLKFVKHPLTSKGEEKQSISGPESTLGKIMALIRGTTGVDFTYYKPNTIIRRLERRISINQISSYENYVSFLENSEKEINTLYKELLIGVTKFFRDQESFDILIETVIPSLFKSKNKDESVRLWSVGCSTGEEAYSLAILLREHMDKYGQNHEIKIFATDLDKESIEYGSMGFYTESIVADVSAERLKKFFIKKDKGYQIKESIRKMVIFATHNIIKDPPFSKIDLISCRNMLIYLKPVMQKKVLSLFHFSLNKKGYLFLGSSESLGDLSKSFTIINSKWKIYGYKESYSNDILGDMLLPVLNSGKTIHTIPDSPEKTGSNNNDIAEGIYQTILEEFIPPSVIVDENFEIVHIYKDVNKYIKLPAGKVTFDILSLVRKELSTTVSIAVHKALKENKEVVYNDFKLKDEGEINHLNIKVKPLKEKIKSKRLVFIFFEELEKEKVSESNQNEEVIEYDTIQQIRDLELELKYTKENLQATIEELGTSNEELQATNEELISSNEELQSTNEELQSVNEELYTVNSEYQNKIDVLTQLNNDINNLLKNTNIGTVFLDRNLLIRKFTPAVTSAINILEMDIGRPIHHISHNTSYENFIEDIENVLRNLVPREVEVQGKKNNWFLMRILPYRTLENAIDGVVITFFDITERKIFEEEIERKSKLLISVLDNSPIASTILDKTGKITYANRLAEKVLGIGKQEIISRVANASTWRITDEFGNPFPDEKLPFFLVKKTGKPVFDIIHNIEWPNGTVKTLSINGSPIFDEKKNVDGVVCTLEDITEKRKMEDKLIREHNLFIRILENSHNAQFLIDKNGKITFANQFAYDLLNIEKDEDLSKKSFIEFNLKPTENIGANKSIVEKVIKTGSTVFNVRHEYLNPINNSTEILFLTASPAFDELKKVEGVVISIDKHNDLVINSELLEKQVNILGNKVNRAFFSIDLKSNVVSWNQKAEEITEVKSCSVLGKKCYSNEKNLSNQKKTPCFMHNLIVDEGFCRNMIIETRNKNIKLHAEEIEIIYSKKKQVIGAIIYFEKLL